MADRDHRDGRGAMRPMTEIRCVLFDLDGTLVDSAPGITQAANTVLGPMGGRALDQRRVETLIGDGSEVFFMRAIKEAGVKLADFEEIRATLERMVLALAALPSGPDVLFAGALETLSAVRARGLKTGLCTNKPEAATLPMLDQTGLASLLDVVVCPDTAGARKPDPKPLLLAAERIGIDPVLCMMVGDNRNDVAAGRGAGMATVATRWGYRDHAPEDLGADRIIETLPELAAVLGLDPSTAPAPT